MLELTNLPMPIPSSSDYLITSKLWAVVTHSVRHLDEVSDVGLLTEEDELLAMAWNGSVAFVIL